MQVQYEGDNWRPDLSTTQTKVSLSSDPAEGHQSNWPSGFDLTDSKSIRIDQTNERFLLFFFCFRRKFFDLVMASIGSDRTVFGGMNL